MLLCCSNSRAFHAFMASPSLSSSSCPSLRLHHLVLVLDGGGDAFDSDFASEDASVVDLGTSVKL